MTTHEPMQRLAYRVQFTTPAFLGNAEQSAQWRTPPFKALLRQWWRVVHAAQAPAFSLEGMRRAEARLFGHAWLDGDEDFRGGKVAARRSEIRLRLSEWSNGKLLASRWTPLPSVDHPNVKARVAADLYLGKLCRTPG